MRNRGAGQFETGVVLGTRLDVTSYAEVLDRVVAMARSGVVGAVAAANTHLIGEAVADAGYAAALHSFELVVPDGMPLVWALQMDGHIIRERVYGPYLMEHVLTHAPSGFKHYFFGGTSECLEKLVVRSADLNPLINITGRVSPPFEKWDAETETRLISDINDSGADFVWVALGGVKQERWIADNRHRFRKGVFLAVGDAFALVAGLRPYAPEWMQRAGLTWIYRLVQEPRRLLSRYVRYNSRFVAAFMMDRLRQSMGIELNRS